MSRIVNIIYRGQTPFKVTELLADAIQYAGWSAVTGSGELYLLEARHDNLEDIMESVHERVTRIRKGEAKETYEGEIEDTFESLKELEKILKGVDALIFTYD